MAEYEEFKRDSPLLFSSPLSVNCGGGSGYLVYMKKPLDNPSYSLWVKPGFHGQSSTVSIAGINTTANPGQDSSLRNGFYWGGNGYSGGE